MVYPPDAGQSGPDYVSYTLQDAGGNVVAEVDGFGYGPLFQFRYAPYGEYQAYENAENGADIDVQATTEALWQPFGFQGGWYDQETGLICFGHRCYDPRTGRWLQADPYSTGLVYTSALAFNGQAMSADPDLSTELQYANGLSLYEYVGSNPIDRRDPSGLMFEDEGYRDDLLITRDWDDIYESITDNGSAYLGAQGAATWGAFWGGNVTALPKFANGMAGVSEGFSEFADYYADQVISLPIQGVFAAGSVAGAGRFIAAGQQGGRAGRYAAIAFRQRKGHHSFPKWMGGFSKQWMADIPWKNPALHQRLEQRIREAMGAAFQRPIGSAAGSTKKWERYFRDNPGEQRRALEVLRRVYKEFDRQYGTRLTESLRRTLKEDLFEFYE
jgi:RHS repeat-associated protein